MYNTTHRIQYGCPEGRLKLVPRQGAVVRVWNRSGPDDRAALSGAAGLRRNGLFPLSLSTIPFTMRHVYQDHETLALSCLTVISTW